MRKLFLSFLLAAVVAVANAQELTAQQQKAKQNLERAMALTDMTIEKCFTGSDGDFRMYDIYNMTLKRGEGTADVWPYTAALEAVCSIIEAIDELGGVLSEEEAQQHRTRYVTLLKKLYNNLEYYSGTFTLTSYARNNTQWTVYGVHRGGKGTTNVSGIENVYDDQEWIIRELVRAFQLTGDYTYLTKAESLAIYVIDGWDCVPDANGNDEGGITWGPGYTSKHSCSNGPFIQPLVWLSEIYKTKTTTPQIYQYKVEQNGARTREYRLRREYYLEMARKIYDWQKRVLLKSGNVFHDAVWVAGDAIDKAKAAGATVDNLGIAYETVGGKRYRMHLPLGNPGGTAFTYNLGAWLSGGVELFKATGDYDLFKDITTFAQSGYSKFTKDQKIGDVTYRQFPTYDRIEDNGTANGFNVWFNNVLVRAWADAMDFADSRSGKGGRDGLEAIQQNLDYAWEHHKKDPGFLPFDLLGGWQNEKNTKGFHQLAYAAEYAKLVKYQLRKTDSYVNATIAIEGEGGAVEYLARKATTSMVVRLWQGMDLNIRVVPGTDYKIESVTIGEEDITDQIDANGLLCVKNVTSDITVNVKFSSTTGIASLQLPLGGEPGGVYDLQGRRMSEGQYAHSVYIKDGKKMVSR
ncbi:MAG: alpha-1,6-mannanase [Prevotella sp.]|nr:alpha-1,6-mannanase [Prevotella sp.]